MNARRRDMEYTTQGYFQLVIRLQVVRMHVHDKLRCADGAAQEPAETKDIVCRIQAVAIAAHEAGLFAFTSICLHVCERIDPSLRSGYISKPTLALVAEWTANAELYLRRPRFVQFAKAMLLQLNDRRWGEPLDPHECETLLEELTHGSNAWRSIGPS
jgi:hypothetical protein